MVPSFISQALVGIPLTVYGEGTQTRSLQYADDLVDGVLRLIRSDEGRPFNMGNPVEHTVREIAELVIEIVHQPLPGDESRRRCPDITRARESLGWEPQTPIGEGLEKTLAWFAR